MTFLLVAFVAACRAGGGPSLVAGTVPAAADAPAAVDTRADTRADTRTDAQAGARPARTPDQNPLVDAQARAEVGRPAPDFELQDLRGRKHKLSAYRGKIVVLEWFDPTCPAVVYAYGEGELRELKSRHASNGIVWIAINSSAAGEDGADPQRNRQFAAAHRLRQPILLDPTGAVGRAWGAHTAPHFFVVNERGQIVYSGALDNAPRGRVESLASKQNFVDMAIADLRSGHGVLKSSTRPYGCEIKYPRP